jgi:hypothetical protein
LNFPNPGSASRISARCGLVEIFERETFLLTGFDAVTFTTVNGDVGEDEIFKDCLPITADKGILDKVRAPLATMFGDKEQNVKRENSSHPWSTNIVAVAECSFRECISST